MIEANALSKSFTKSRGFFSGKTTVHAIGNISFTAENNKITGLLGANGAGKSTTLRILASLVKPDAGSAIVDGYDLTKNPVFARKHIGFLPHNAGIYPRLSARENVEYYGYISGFTKTECKRRVGEIMDLLEMHAYADRRAEGFSQGQRTKVALARALVHRPKTLILDEPTNGLDVMATRKLRQILFRLRDEGHCILLSSHIMQEVSTLCDHIAIIHEGCITMSGSVGDIQLKTQQEDLEDAFIVAIGEPLELSQ